MKRCVPARVFQRWNARSPKRQRVSDNSDATHWRIHCDHDLGEQKLVLQLPQEKRKERLLIDLDFTSPFVNTQQLYFTG